MLSLKHKFLFIHTPKTGGNAIQSALLPYTEDKRVCINARQDGIERFEIRRDDFTVHKHFTLAEYAKALPKDVFTNLFKFSVVRNPWDRAISFYFSPHRGSGLVWDREKFIQLLAAMHTDEHYITLANVACPLDYVLRFEHLATDFSTLVSKLGLPSLELPRRNQSIDKPFMDYRKYYDSELQQQVAAKFASTIANFGYSF